MEVGSPSRTAILTAIHRAAHFADLKDNAEKHAFSRYVACTLGFEGMLSFRRCDLASAERLLRASLNGLRAKPDMTFFKCHF
jgi:hypothetical protein